MIKFDLFSEWLASVLDGTVPHIYNNSVEQDVKNEDFMLLRSLSQFEDCLAYSNLANEKMNGKIDPKLLYDFLFYAIPKKKRYSGKWGKAVKEPEHIEVIARAFNCNRERAKEYSTLISKENLEQLVRDFTDMGGK